MGDGYDVLGWVWVVDLDVQGLRGLVSLGLGYGVASGEASEDESRSGGYRRFLSSLTPPFSLHASSVLGLLRLEFLRLFLVFLACALSEGVSVKLGYGARVLLFACSEAVVSLVCGKGMATLPLLRFFEGLDLLT
ncbi:unnamed protein product [Arabis nemorensis]|uniref:Uncharacterized protein n=1 Tax=Arabis nemorensis TaxID=586526 RepID=A0A565B0X2_9BRAS|nr:unnamed protein product [Arabis nemorensis]